MVYWLGIGLVSLIMENLCEGLKKSTLGPAWESNLAVSVGDHANLTQPPQPSPNVI